MGGSAQARSSPLTSVLTTQHHPDSGDPSLDSDPRCEPATSGSRDCSGPGVSAATAGSRVRIGGRGKEKEEASWPRAHPGNPIPGALPTGVGLDPDTRPRLESLEAGQGAGTCGPPPDSPALLPAEETGTPEARDRQAKFLSQDQINEYKECFSLYDKQQRGRMKACDLLVAMRCLGASPTPGEVQRHLQTHGIDSSGELDFSTFLTVMHTQIKQEDPKKEILLAMLMADKEKKGYIMASELRSKLTRLGEKLTHKEVDDLFREAQVDADGRVQYDDFIDRVTLPVQEY
ncbi:calmodulin-like protein 4 [Tupaia chinensis]|uniref:calmodulin-like protein 4 n=1 Tax=Tupaia chinensis TaxID=246437 RepID=UPI000FFB1A5A|nr:calmodulin-like protein 4 [Tupaia chinensis]